MMTQSTPEERLRVQRWKASMHRQTFNVLIHQPGIIIDEVVTPPTTSERQSVILGFTLGALSIFCSFFPICGLPIAITGLLIGLNSRHIKPLQRMVAWTIALALVGLSLALVNCMIGICIYLVYYLWQ